MRVPFPSISSELAVKSHMYICQYANGRQHSFVKCQTLKPYMLLATSPMKHYCDEQPNLSRNPFKNTTRIYCDKLFSSRAVKYDLSLLTSNRSDVCDDLFNKIIIELTADGYQNIQMNEQELVQLNRSSTL